MDVFFVRHGETAFNKRHVHQPADAPLDELGQKQALRTAKVIHGLRPTHLLSSTMTRAQETANIMNRSLKLPHESLSMLEELRRPEYIIGYKHFGLRSLWYMLRWFYSYRTDFHTNGRGESRLHFLRRVTKARGYLEQLPPDARVVVVTHSIFINFFVEHICNENPVPIWKAVLILMKIKQLDNSSLTHVTFDPKAPEKSCRWTLIAFDSDEHVVQ